MVLEPQLATVLSFVLAVVIGYFAGRLMGAREE
jgi:hypothetical protein